ncbi:MAG: hypothetical protein HQL47_04005 [Gammaproteobacteria bacterium]|nr:hypothetical protein [Gammaproteobacteria bacterium]
MKPSPIPRPRLRPSKRPGFRLAAFVVAIGIFVLSYWLGNRYQSPQLPELQALLLSPAQPLPEFELLEQDQPQAFASLVDDWLLLGAGRLELADLQLLTSAHNRLAADAKLQGRFRVWLLEPSDLPLSLALPEFIRVKTLTPAARQALAQAWQLSPDQHLLFLINPQGRLQAVFTGISSAATMAADFQAIVDHYTP